MPEPIIEAGKSLTLSSHFVFSELRRKIVFRISAFRISGPREFGLQDFCQLSGFNPDKTEAELSARFCVGALHRSARWLNLDRLDFKLEVDIVSFFQHRNHKL